MLDCILDRTVKSDFKAQKLIGIGGAEIDVRLRALGDGVDADAAVDGAEVEGGARLVGKRSFGKRGEGSGKRGDGVGSAGVGETVAAGSGNGDLVAAAAEGLRDGGVGAGSIENNVSGDAAGERAVLVDMAHAAQVALTFFANVAEDDEWNWQVRWPAWRSAVTMANIPATPAALSLEPGASRRSPSRTGLSGVPAGKTVSMCAERRMTGQVQSAGRLSAGKRPRTLPAASISTLARPA